MIIVGARIKICDNSGGRIGKCIRVFKKRNKDIAGVILAVSVKFVNIRDRKRKVTVGQLSRAVVVRENNRFWLFGGHTGRCGSNAIVLVKGDNEMVGTRVFGPISNKLRSRGFVKLLAVSRFIY
jgi:large subunit ribosomal protein L14